MSIYILDVCISIYTYIYYNQFTQTITYAYENKTNQQNATRASCIPTKRALHEHTRALNEHTRALHEHTRIYIIHEHTRIYIIQSIDTNNDIYVCQRTKNERKESPASCNTITGAFSARALSLCRSFFLSHVGNGRENI